jgi:electron-transferring-flavoprotein dehydrogenase
MKSGMLAAESAFEAIVNENSESETIGLEPRSYEEKIRNSWIWSELKSVRNIRPSFHNPLGLYGGLMYSGISMLIRGKEPWTLSHGGKSYCDLMNYLFTYIHAIEAYCNWKI